LSQEVPISQVQNMRDKINTKGTVKSKGEVRNVNMRAGGTIDVCDAILSDDSGEIKLTLWGIHSKAKYPLLKANSEKC